MKKIFTTMFMMLCIVGNAVWGQNSSGEGWSYDEDTKTLTITGDRADDFQELEIHSVIIKNNVTTLGSSAFYNHEELENVEFEENSKLTELGFGVFYGCTGLTSVELPASMKKLGENCFWYCGLKSITIPKGVTEICNNAFGASQNLTSITFEEGSELTTIGSGAFPDELRSIVIPAGVTSVGTWFLGYSTTRVEFLGTKVPQLSDSYEDRLPIENENCIIIVPKGMKASFEADEKWGNYPYIFEKGTEPKEGSVRLIYDAKNIKKEGLPEWVCEGDVFTIYPIDGYDDLSIIYSTSAFNHDWELPCEVTVNDFSSSETEVYLSIEAYAPVLDGEEGNYYFDPSSKSMLVRRHSSPNSTVSILSKVRYKDGTEYDVKRIADFPATSTNKHLIIPETIEFIDTRGLNMSPYEWETVEFLGTVPPTAENNDTGLENATIIVQNEEAKEAFEASDAFKGLNIVVNTKTKVSYNITGSGSITFSYGDKLAASYEEVPAGVTEITMKAEPLMGNKLKGQIKFQQGDGEEQEISDGETVSLTSGNITITAEFETDDSQNEKVEEAKEEATEVVAPSESIAETISKPTVIGSFEGENEVSIVSEPVKDEDASEIISAYKENEGEEALPAYENTVALDIKPVIFEESSVSEATVSSKVAVAFPYPDGLGKGDFENIAVLHMKSNGDFEYFSEEKGNMNLKETHIELTDIDGFSPFILMYKAASSSNPPAITIYYDLNLIKSEGAKLISRHNKTRVKAGGSFTLSLEKEAGYEDCEPTVYVRRGRSGSWEALKMDEVSGYYQIRNVQSDIWVKVSGDGIWAVANEEVTAQNVRAYAVNGKIVVVTPQPKEVVIASMSGAVVANERVAGQREFGNLPAGIYVVCVGSEKFKLNIR